MAIVNPQNLSQGTPVRVRRGSEHAAHTQFRLDQEHNRSYGACFDISTHNEMGAFLQALANEASYVNEKSLATNSTNYMGGALHRNEDGAVVFVGEFQSVPVWARPFFDGGTLRVGWTDDSVPQEVSGLL